VCCVKVGENVVRYVVVVLRGLWRESGLRHAGHWRVDILPDAVFQQDTPQTGQFECAVAQEVLRHDEVIAGLFIVAIGRFPAQFLEADCGLFDQGVFRVFAHRCSHIFLDKQE